MTATTNTSKSAPFIRWSECKSTDMNNPHVRRYKLVGTEIYESIYAEYLLVEDNTEGQGQRKKLPVKSYDSNNDWLKKQLNEHISKGTLVPGQEFTVKRWLEKSKDGKWQRRMFKVEV